MEKIISLESRNLELHTHSGSSFRVHRVQWYFMSGFIGNSIIRTVVYINKQLTTVIFRWNSLEERAKFVSINLLNGRKPFERMESFSSVERLPTNSLQRKWNLLLNAMMHNQRFNQRLAMTFKVSWEGPETILRYFSARSAQKFCLKDDDFLPLNISLWRMKRRAIKPSSILLSRLFNIKKFLLLNSHHSLVISLNSFFKFFCDSSSFLRRWWQAA